MRSCPFSSREPAVKKSPNLVGKWSGTVGTSTGAFEFKEDNKLTLAVTTVGGAINLLGDYKLTGDNVTVTITDVQVPGQSDKTVAMIKDSFKGLLNKPQDYKIVFTSEDEASFCREAESRRPKGSERPRSGRNDAQARERGIVSKL